MQTTQEQPKKPGLFIVIEGMDGSGKTTALQYLSKRLKELQVNHICTREPGGTPVATKLRSLIVNNEEETIDPMARLLMVLAGRIQHLKNLVHPKIKEGVTVISDRYSDSTYVYQGCMDGLKPALLLLENMEEMRYLSLRPDITLFMDVTPEVALARTQNERESDNTLTEGSIEKMQKHYQHYHERMQQVSETNPNSVFLIDASLDIEEVKKYLDSFANLVADRTTAPC